MKFDQHYKDNKQACWKQAATGQHDDFGTLFKQKHICHPTVRLQAILPFKQTPLDNGSVQRFSGFIFTAAKKTS